MGRVHDREDVGVFFGGIVGCVSGSRRNWGKLRLGLEPTKFT